MGSTDYRDLDEVPESTASTTAAVARNAAHVAGVLKAAQTCPIRFDPGAGLTEIVSNQPGAQAQAEKSVAGSAD